MQREMPPVGTTGNLKERKTMSTQAECVKVLQTEFERLKQYLAALPQDAWTTPSVCTLWEVRDVVAHLIFAANYYTDCITRGLREDTSTPAGRPEPSSFHTASQEERQQRATAGAQRMIVLRESLGQELLDVFCQTGDHFNHLVARLSPHEWDTLCHHGRGIIPVRLLVSGVVFERAIHGWDIRSALEPSAHLSPEALTVMPDHFAECLHWFFLPSRAFRKSMTSCFRHPVEWGSASPQPFRWARGPSHKE